MSNIHSLRKLSEADKENVKRANSFMIDPRIIQIEPGFNPRGMFTENYWEQPDTLAHIECFGEWYWVRYINYHGSSLTLRLQPEDEPLSPFREHDRVVVTVPGDLMIDVEAR